MSTASFQDLWRTWSHVLSNASSTGDEEFKKIFSNFVHEGAGYCLPHGLDKIEFVDRVADMAASHGYLTRFSEDDLQTLLTREIAEVEENIEHVPDAEYPWDDQQPATNGKDTTTPPPLTPSKYVFPDPETIPKRAWLYSWHYMRGAVTATVAPGGFGKTTLALYEAMLMAAQGLRIWYISGEDDRTEIDRRLAAHVKVNKAAMQTSLYVDDRMSFPFKIARMGKSGLLFDEALLANFEAAVATEQIDLIILDPFISFHFLNENDTAAMDTMIKRLGEICYRRQCGIELSHHVRKPTTGQSEITVYDARGAGAIVNAVRSCRVLNQMSMVEAEQADIKPDKRASYIRVDSGKRNMAPPEKAKWCSLVSVEIANGDNVQAIEAFTFAPVRAGDADRDWVRLLLRGNLKRYRADSRSPDWLGRAIADHFGRDTTVKGHVIWIAKLIKQWLAEGVFVKTTGEDEQRKIREFYVLPADAPKPTSNVVQFPSSDDGDEL